MHGRSCTYIRRSYNRMDVVCLTCIQFRYVSVGRSFLAVFFQFFFFFFFSYKCYFENLIFVVLCLSLTMTYHMSKTENYIVKAIITNSFLSNRNYLKLWSQDKFWAKWILLPKLLENCKTIVKLLHAFKAFIFLISQDELKTPLLLNVLDGTMTQQLE